MKRYPILLCAVLLLAGCAGSPVRTGIASSKNLSNMLKLDLGMTKEQVLSIMGEPYKTEVYRTGEKKAVEFWLYWTEATVAGYSVSDKNFTPLAFETAGSKGGDEITTTILSESRKRSPSDEKEVEPVSADKADKSACLTSIVSSKTR